MSRSTEPGFLRFKGLVRNMAARVRSMCCLGSGAGRGFTVFTRYRGVMVSVKLENKFTEVRIADQVANILLDEFFVNDKGQSGLVSCGEADLLE